jgi:hypothetical protein
MAEVSQKAVISSDDKKQLNPKLLLAFGIVALVALLIGGWLGFSYGKTYRNKQMLAQVGLDNKSDVPASYQQKLFGKDVNLGDNAGKNKEAIDAILNNTTHEQMQKASFDELVQALSYAQLSLNKEKTAMIKEVLQQRKSQFTQEQQANLQKLGL